MWRAPPLPEGESAFTAAAISKVPPPQRKDVDTAPAATGGAGIARSGRGPLTCYHRAMAARPTFPQQLQFWSLAIGLAALCAACADDGLDPLGGQSVLGGTTLGPGSLGPSFFSPDAGGETDAPLPSGPVVAIAAAGDIAGEGGQQGLTSDLLMQLVRARSLAAILTLGDNAYPYATLDDFRRFYQPSWGVPALKALTHPAPGNHEYSYPEATGYFDYFNGVGQNTGPAGERGRGYYSFDVGAWHLISLNSNTACTSVACDAASAQVAWLKADLTKNTARCTLAYWHHPRFNQGVQYGDVDQVAGLWDALYDADADVVLEAHEHNYQQFAPLDKNGAVDRSRGIRSFIVGTGGGAAFYRSFTAHHSDAAEVRIIDTAGVIEFDLAADSYTWRFVSKAGLVLAAGSDACH